MSLHYCGGFNVWGKVISLLFSNFVRVLLYYYSKSLHDEFKGCSRHECRRHGELIYICFL